MSSLLSYGTYFPHYHVEDKVLSPRFGRKGKRSVSFVDEDIITQAYEAAQNCFSSLPSSLHGLKGTVDAVFFATTSLVFKGRYHASFLADLLNLPQEITALDFCLTPRAGTDALMLAHQLIDAGIHKNILVVASEINFSEVGEEARNSFGHAAVALLVGKEKGFAEIISAKSFSSAIAENFFYKNERVSLDPRYSRDAGFKNNIKSALEKCGVKAAESDAVILNSLFAKLAGGIFFKAGFKEEQFAKDNLTSNIGFTGSCHALLQLVDAIENKKKSILLFDYFNGINVLSIHVSTAFTSNQFKKDSAGISYQDYLTLLKAGNFNSTRYQSSEMFSSEMMNEREKETLIWLNGLQCNECKTIYLIKSARCKKCKCEKFSKRELHRTGIVYSLTKEYYFPSSFPPITMAVIDLDGGGRITVQMTDDLFDEGKNKIQIGSKVKLVLRKMMENGKRPDYFWKCKLI